jgi:hypothetical protein
MAKWIILYGYSLYGEALEQLDQLVEGLTDLGHQVDRVDLREHPEGINRAVRGLTPPYAGAIAWDGVGVELGTAERRPLFDAMGIPLILWLRRHPAYYLRQLNLPIKGMRVVCSDGSHLGFMQRYFDHLPACCIMPGATVGSGAIWEGGPYNTILAATYYDPDQVRGGWLKLPRTIHPFIEQTCEAALAQPQQPLDLIGQAIAKNRSGVLTPEQVAVLPYIDVYLRGLRRRQWLDTLTQANISIDIFGQEWAAYPHIASHRYHGPIANPRLLALLHHTDLLLVPGSGTPDSIHPSVLSALSAGASVLTEPNPYLTAQLPTLPTADATTLLSAIQSSPGRQPLNPLPDHSWTARARQLTSWLKIEDKSNV